MPDVRRLLLSLTHEGHTKTGNTVLLCGQHHRVVHHSHWTVRIAEDGLPEFTPPAWVDPDQQPRRHIRHLTPETGDP